MAIEHAPVWRCEQCGHRWLIEDPLKPPKWCAKCRSRKWDASGAAQAGVQSPPPTFVPLPPVDVNAGFSLTRRAPKGSMPPVPAPVLMPGDAPVAKKNTAVVRRLKERLDSDNRARLDKLNAAKYQKKK